MKYNIFKLLNKLDHKMIKMLHTLTSILSTPLPIRTIILSVLNFSKSSFVRTMVCHIKAPTASFKT